ncbi:hypothetical protein BSU04_21235 [Caballeronia sordidicola]|uniref:Uncharacterized protein n=1 Tax=Caballeronia sordidicola TaxID=196367 RepID=A0A226WZD0_CABSO|nr:hypothetical protein BSU04_21235 [Caballeronia sordidicola]
MEISWSQVNVLSSEFRISARKPEAPVGRVWLRGICAQLQAGQRTGRRCNVLR